MEIIENIAQAQCFEHVQVLRQIGALVWSCLKIHQKISWKSFKKWSKIFGKTVENGAANRDLQKTTKKHEKGSPKGGKNAGKTVQKWEKKRRKKGGKTKAQKTNQKPKNDRPSTIGGRILIPRGGIKGGVNPPLGGWGVEGMLDRGMYWSLNHLSPEAGGILGQRNTEYVTT